MAGFRVKRIKFLSDGFASILTSSGVDGAVASAARSQAQAREVMTGVSYEVRKDRSWDGRSAYLAKPSDEESPDGDEPRGRVPNLDHETWVSKVWPKVGGPKWRPHS